MYVKTGNYTGNGVDNRSITGIGFQPDVVIVKRMDGADGAFFRSASMASGKSITLRSDSGVVDNVIQALNSDGFEVGTDNAVNLNTATYTYIALKDDGSGDFGYGSYVGNGTDARSITLQSTFAFNWLVIKGDLGRTGAYKNAALTGDKTHPFYFSGTNLDQIQATMSTTTGTVELGTSDFVNANAVTYYWFGFKEVSGQSYSSTYNGNGTDNRDITAPGFEPTFVWIKQETSSDPRFRTSGHTGDNSQSFDSTQGANDIQGFVSTGFTLGNNSQVNTSAGTPLYHYIALKERVPAAGAVKLSTLMILGVG